MMQNSLIPLHFAGPFYSVQHLTRSQAIVRLRVQGRSKQASGAVAGDQQLDSTRIASGLQTLS